jgi:dipeptidyl-peptidase-4
MGTPQNNATGYLDSSVMTHVPTMSGKLMLVHGLIDENVHFRHTARLINTLISARKRYELVLFPCERHSPHKLQDKIYIEDIMQEFLCNNLHPVLPAANAAVVGGVSGAAAGVAGQAPKLLASL